MSNKITVSHELGYYDTLTMEEKLDYILKNYRFFIRVMHDVMEDKRVQNNYYAMIGINDDESLELVRAQFDAYMVEDVEMVKIFMDALERPIPKAEIKKRIPRTAWAL